MLCDLLLLFSLFNFSSGFLIPELQNVHLYVSPTGSDLNVGTDASIPMRTLHRAIQRISEPDIQNKNIWIELMEGYHDLNSTLVINHRNDYRRITIRAYQNQKVHVTGGKRIPSNHFTKVTDPSILQRLTPEAQTHVLQTKLSDTGITDLGQIVPYGKYILRQAPLEIFENGFPLTLSRWPNYGFKNITNVPSGQRYSTVFEYDSDRPKKWANQSDIWVYGYWYQSWADKAVPVKTIDAQHKTISLAQPTHFGLRAGQTHPGGGYFRFINILDEIDEPVSGEYFIDRITGMLYLWPAFSKGLYTSNDVIYGSMINTCIQLTRYTSNVVFENFILEACRHFGIQAQDSSNITIQSMEIRNTGSYNVYCRKDCRNFVISKSYLHDGDGGVTLQGGDRPTLTSSNNFIIDSEISFFSRVTSSDANAITLDGVGGHIEHNIIYRGQYTAIRWTGNDHSIQYNNVFENCMNSSDCGAIHSGKDWAARGTVIRFNHIHHNLQYYYGADVRGVMLDDQYSSVLVEKNVFYNNAGHLNIGGGRDNIVRDNIFFNSTKFSIQVDGRGSSHRNDRSLMNILNKLPYKNKLWTSKYPKLVNILNENPEEPRGNQIYKNIFYNSGKQYTVKWDPHKPAWFDVHSNIISNSTNDFNFPKLPYADFRTRCALTTFVKSNHLTTPLLPGQTGPRYHVGPPFVTPRPAWLLGGSHGNQPSLQGC
ncbi:uncharacterized protein LOC134689845 [Mytilus trossulus]|uniref:uncharacterized protein LOC134689845 n=1 Tax=Mytilus trossulus TaxID=6551 RepID=UPI0030076CDF